VIIQVNFEFTKMIESYQINFHMVLK
jgi:hypothetical protein